MRGGHSASREHSSSRSSDQPEYGCDRASRVLPRPPGHDPAEAVLRLSAAVAAALGHVPHGQWALLNEDMRLLIDRSACLVEPVAVELLLLLPCLRCSRSKHDRRRVRSPLTKPIARPPDLSTASCLICDASTTASSAVFSVTVFSALNCSATSAFTALLCSAAGLAIFATRTS